jgi:hypothetical protein
LCAPQGLRTICVASRKLPSGINVEDLDAVEKDLALVCLARTPSPPDNHP